MAITKVGESGTAATGTSINVSWPVGVQAGDVAVLAVEYRAGSNTTVGSSGFNSDGATDSTTSAGLETFTKVCTGLETGNQEVTLSGSGADRAAISLTVWRGVDTSNPLDAATTGSTASSGTSIAAPAITTVTNGAAVLHYHGGRIDSGSTNSYTADGNTTELTDNHAGTNPNISLLCAWETKATAGAVSARTATSANSLNTSACRTVALRPSTASNAPRATTLRRFRS